MFEMNGKSSTDRQNRRFSQNRFSAAGHFKDFVKWVVLVIDL